MSTNESEVVHANAHTHVGRLQPTEPQAGDLAIHVRLTEGTARLAMDAILGALAQAGLISLPESKVKTAEWALRDFADRDMHIESIRHAVYGGQSGTWL